MNYNFKKVNGGIKLKKLKFGDCFVYKDKSNVFMVGRYSWFSKITNKYDTNETIYIINLSDGTVIQAENIDIEVFLVESDVTFTLKINEV